MQKQYKRHRSFSHPGLGNRGFIDDDSSSESNKASTIIDSDHSTINFVHQSSTKKIGDIVDKSELQIRRLSIILQQPAFTRVVALTDQQADGKNNDVLISSVVPHTAIDIAVNAHREVKSGSQRWRWNLIFNLIIWLIVPLPLWLPFASNTVALYLIPSVQLIFALMWLTIAICATKNALALYVNRDRDFSKEAASQGAASIRYIFVISCYKEPIDLIAASIQTLANQTEVHRITMVVGLEERTPDKEEKCRYLEARFHQCGFERMIFTIHPYNLPNEIPGKCSNANYSIRMAVKEMNISEKDTDNILVTTCDADSKFSPQYVAALTSKYLQENRPALTTLYQSPLFYNWKLDAASFVTRVTGILRSFLMLGALIPFNINTMSIYSYSLSLGVQGNYIHPGYQMDDIICLIRWTGLTRRRLRISIVPVPVLSGPTSGETVETDITEWARQARRWTIGAAEVFHYFVVKAKRMSCTAACSWGTCFIIYYGILLCTSGLYGLTSTVSMFVLMKNVPLLISYIMYGLFAIQMLTFLVAFVIDMFIPPLLNVQENVSVVRNAFHFLMTPLVLLGYSLVELYALHEIALLGKKVCKHGASKKTMLA